MSTTTIRLPDELRARVEAVAASEGSSVHAFMLKAIAEVADRSERQTAFHQEAERRLQEMQETGRYYTHEDMRDYALALARGEATQRREPRQMNAQELARFKASMQRKS